MVAQTLQAFADVLTVPHRPPDEAGFAVFDHPNHGALIEAEYPGGDPPVAVAGLVRESGVETGCHAVCVEALKLQTLDDVKESRDDNLRGEWQRSCNCPRRDSPIVGSRGSPAGKIAVEDTALAIYFERGGTGSVARRQPPDEFTVVPEAAGIFDGVLALDIGGAAAVFEIVEAGFAVGVIMKIAKVQLDMGMHSVNPSGG